jgi:glycosyltransferase involved in cell wall biosynthesis
VGEYNRLREEVHEWMVDAVGSVNTMKVLHIPFVFHPDPVGGTEVYVESLAHELTNLGIENIIAAAGVEEKTYRHNGLTVRRYQFEPTPRSLREQYGQGDPVALAHFEALLHREQPDIVHLHAYTRAVSLPMLRAAKRLNIPVVFTYHTPAITCMRGTLLRWGSDICDGRLDVSLCSACALNQFLPSNLSIMLSQTPVSVGKALEKLNLKGKLATALRMRELMTLQHASMRALFEEADHVVVLCDWTAKLLEINGFHLKQLSLVRHGITSSSRANTPSSKPERASQKTLRMIYIGRILPMKGLHVLVPALRALPLAPLELDIFGAAPDEAYLQTLNQLAADDPRIRFHASVPNDQVVSLLSQYDLLVVPSQVLETGPLVVLEAFAAGTPVMGSDLGGIAELVEDNMNGILVEADSVTAWQRALGRLVNQPELLPQLKQRVKPPPTMADVAQQMNMIYQALAVQSTISASVL